MQRLSISISGEFILNKNSLNGILSIQSTKLLSYSSKQSTILLPIINLLKDEIYLFNINSWFEIIYSSYSSYSSLQVLTLLTSFSNLHFYAITSSSSSSLSTSIDMDYIECVSLGMSLLACKSSAELDPRLDIRSGGRFLELGLGERERIRI